METATKHNRAGTPGWALLLFLVLGAGFAGCAGSGQGYVDPNVNFGVIKRAAVLPFENLSRDNLSAERLHSVFLMELLNANVLQIADVGETYQAMHSLGLSSGSRLTPEQAVALGKKLGVDALFFGVIEEYGLSQVDRKRGPEVTASFGMIETETGSVIWRAQANATGSSTLKKVFGGGSSSLYDVSRDVVRKALRTLL